MAAVRRYKPSVWRRLRTWLAWLPYRWRPVYDECEVCERRSKRNVTLTAAKERTAGGLVGGSSISATFCPEHLPK